MFVMAFSQESTQYHSYDSGAHNSYQIVDLLELNPGVPGGRVEMFALPDEDHR